MQLLASIGLALDIVGVLIIFKWGPPQPEMSGGVGLGLESGTPLGDGRTVADEEASQAATKRMHEIMSRVGLGIVALGFLLQLIALWI